jgi:hypothetical protein
MLPHEVTDTEVKSEPAPGLAPNEGKVPKPAEPIEAEVTLSGQAPTKVIVTPVDVAPDGKEATVKVTVQPKPAEGEETPNLAPLLFVAAVAALVLVTSGGPPAGRAPQ